MQPVLKFGLNPFKEYEIEFVKLSNGEHSYKYIIKEDFFALFENDLVTKGDIKVNITLDKRDSFYEVIVDHKGTINVSCDRCLDLIDFPVEGNQRLVLKIAEEEEEKEDENVLYISLETQSINLAQTIYELISLSLPMVRYCDDAKKECNEQMIDKIYGNDRTKTSEETDPRWNKLKDLYKK